MDLIQANIVSKNDSILIQNTKLSTYWCLIINLNINLITSILILVIVDASGACVTAVFNFDTTDQATAREYRMEVC